MTKTKQPDEPTPVAIAYRIMGKPRIDCGACIHAQQKDPNLEEIHVSPFPRECNHLFFAGRVNAALRYSGHAPVAPILQQQWRAEHRWKRMYDEPPSAQLFIQGKSYRAAIRELDTLVSPLWKALVAQPAEFCTRFVPTEGWELEDE